MCNCREKKGFALVLSKAVAFEKSSGKEAAIFSVGEAISFTDKSNINKVDDICCYFTTDNVEHKIVKAKKKSTKKKLSPKKED